MEEIRALTVAEMLAAKEMWQEIFYEDSSQFTDYYFSEKMPDNIGYGVFLEKELCAMLFLTPYTGRVLAPNEAQKSFQNMPLSYIVGVGTKAQYRHRGYMDRLLRRALTQLHDLKQPFSFLMPADPAIYTPYQFRYIYERPTFHVIEKKRCGAEGAAAEPSMTEAGMPLTTVPMAPGEEGLLAEFAEGQLEHRYQLFLHRDSAYYRRQKLESLAQNGDVLLWKIDGAIEGFYLYACEEGREVIQEAMASSRLAALGVLEESEEREPIIMARITNVIAMLSLLRLSPDAGQSMVSLTLRITDPIVSGNNGTFLWTVGKKESTIAVVSDKEEADLLLSIEALTELVFGRVQPGTLHRELSALLPLSHSFINEIV